MIATNRRAHLKDEKLYHEFYNADITPGMIYLPHYDEPRLVWVLDHISSASRVIDIGCHKGELTFAIAEKTSGEVVGIDISPVAISYARSFAARHGFFNITWLDGRAEELPVPEDSFDVAVLCEILEHVVSPARVLREAERVVRNGGRIVMSTPGNALEICRLEAPTRDAATGYELDMHVREFNPALRLKRKKDLKYEYNEFSTGGMVFKTHLASYQVEK